MKVTRRGAFGIGAGAAIAAPTIAKGLASSVANESMNLKGIEYAGQTIGGYYDNCKTTAPECSNDYWLRLVRIAKGQLTDEDLQEIERRVRMDRTAADVDALKSLSHAGRLQVYEHRCFERHKRGRIEDAKRELLAMGNKALLG